MRNKMPDALPAVRVTAVLLVYHQAESACRVVAAVKAQTFPVARLIVVDNASPDASADRIAAAHPDVEIIRLPANLGVGAGHNAGWRAALADPACDFIWTLEHDCFPEPDCLAELVAAHALLFPPHAAFNQMPGVTFPVQTMRYPTDGKLHLALRHFRVRRIRTLPPSAPPEVRPGCSFNGTLLPAVLMRAVGAANEEFFFAREDGDYCQRIYAAGGVL
jgi:GT2 family glycosyltransferase